jgi:protein ImuB
MDRMACIDLPAFPLQLLLRRHGEWRDRPVAVVDSDRPQGKILWVNERARGNRILPGMRYAAGLSLAGDLHAAEMPADEVDRAISALGRRLRCFTPHVEPARDDPGVFWLDASGLERLYGSLPNWAGLIRSELRRSGLECNTTVGFSRFGTYALSKSKRGVLVVDPPTSAPPRDVSPWIASPSSPRYGKRSASWASGPWATSWTSPPRVSRNASAPRSIACTDWPRACCGYRCSPRHPCPRLSSAWGSIIP